jgi:hypothetical protein
MIFQYGLTEMWLQVLALPPHLQAWLLWLLITTFIAPLFFAQHRVARILLYWQAANILFGLSLWSTVGLVRLLSLSHLLFWLPAAIVLFRNRPTRVQMPLHVWIYLALISMSSSLVMDGVDLVRYILGDRDLIGASAWVIYLPASLMNLFSQFSLW